MTSTRFHFVSLWLVALALAADLAVSGTTYSQTREEIGLRIAQDARTRESGFGNYAASQIMVLRNRQGQTNSRKLRVKALEIPDDGDRILFVFDEPRDVKGTALLIHSHRDRPDSQWLYLPALKRVKRISSSSRSGSFMGSEFSYEDLGTREVAKFKYRYVGEETCGELRCTLVESTPVEKGSAYMRQVVWRDLDELRIWKVEYFDRKNAHLKTLTMDKYERYLNHYWRAAEMSMVNHLTGKSTVVRWSDFEFQTDLNERDFSKAALKRIR